MYFSFLYLLFWDYKCHGQTLYLSINAPAILYLLFPIIYLFPHQKAHRLHMRRVDNKDAPSRDLFAKSWILMMLRLRLKPVIWLLHPDASAIEKIRIVFIDEPLTGFGLICNLLFAMAFATSCNVNVKSPAFS